MVIEHIIIDERVEEGGEWIIDIIAAAVDHRHVVVAVAVVVLSLGGSGSQLRCFGTILGIMSRN